ncbi:MAG: hypothetical protein ABSG11_14385 [Candidatus Korobacteraceae bacterium]|jgi:hypothetical protein
MRAKILVAGCLLLLISANAVGQAQADKNTQLLQYKRAHKDSGVYCVQDPILPTDGSSAQDIVSTGNGGTGPNYYLLHLKAGHSYSAEMWSPTGDVTGGAQLTLLLNTNCSPVATSDFVEIDPDLSNSFADRISWHFLNNHDVVLQASSLDTSGTLYQYLIRVTDTTLWNTNWSTYSTLAMQYDFTNTTAATLSGELTVTDVTAGNTTYTSSLSIPAGQQVTKIVAATGIASTGLQVPANHQGYASFAFLGPAGAIVADANVINNTAPNVPLVPSKFEPRFLPH